MLVPVFLPFNLGKYILNAAITMLIYKPIVTALRKANLLAPSSNAAVACSGSATWASSWSPWSCSSPASWASWPGRVCCDTVTCPLLLLNVNSSEEPTLWVGSSFLPTQAFLYKVTFPLDFTQGFSVWIRQFDDFSSWMNFLQEWTLTNFRNVLLYQLVS